MKVIKRDGRIQNYNFLKIESVVSKAFQSVNQETPEKFLEQLKNSIEESFKKKDTLDVEDI